MQRDETTHKTIGLISNMYIFFSKRLKSGVFLLLPLSAIIRPTPPPLVYMFTSHHGTKIIVTTLTKAQNTLGI